MKHIKSIYYLTRKGKINVRTPKIFIDTETVFKVHIYVIRYSTEVD